MACCTQKNQSDIWHVVEVSEMKIKYQGVFTRNVISLRVNSPLVDKM